MTLRFGSYRVSIDVRYVRTNRKRTPLVRAPFLLALIATLPLLAI